MYSLFLRFVYWELACAALFHSFIKLKSVQVMISIQAGLICYIFIRFCRFYLSHQSCVSLDDRLIPV